jgi:hypothetical protein
MVLGQKAKNPRLTGNRGFFKNLLFVQNFNPTMPKRREPRCQSAMQPMTGACFLIFVVNVVLIVNRQ